MFFKGAHLFTEKSCHLWVKPSLVTAMELTHIKDVRSGMKNLNIEFIVLEIGHPTVTKDNREVRSCRVADQTASINISIWDTPGQLLVPGDIVRVSKAYAVIWRNCLTLYSGKSGEVCFFKVENITTKININPISRCKKLENSAWYLLSSLT